MRAAERPARTGEGNWLKVALPIRGHALAATLLLSFVFTFGAIAPAFAHSPGTGSWYWPTGRESFSMSDWWDHRSSSRHLAQDMGRSAGKPVYAIADGTVLESKYVRGYGPGGGLGGAVVILHRTYNGEQFKSLYGHVSKLRYKKGARVKAGAVIAVINRSSPNHLHFGIHPGAKYPSDNNPFRGHTHTSKRTYGWVNPVRYLKTHYRLDPYRAPAVPVVASVDTTLAPSWARARRGRLYWAEATPSGIATWTCELPAGPRRPMESSETIPAHDGGRYALALTASGDTRITVRDRLPRVSIRTSSASPTAGSTVTLSGAVRNSAGSPFVHAWTRVERWDGTMWRFVGGAYTSKSGTWYLKYRPSGRSLFRARFTPPATYATAASSPVGVGTP